MRSKGLVLLLLLGLNSMAQSNMKIFIVKEGDQTVFYAQNNEFCPVSIQMTLDLDNMSSNGFVNGQFVIPQNAQKHRLFSLTGIRPRRKTSYSYNYRAVYGDVANTSYDADYLYDLPFKKGTRVRIEQGYNGKFTHLGENALDFNMSQGSQVRAARNGVVISVVQNFTETCLTEACKSMANHIMIMHSDGTIAEYSHLKYNEARVAVGDSVKQGDLIALSGATGYARGPHLHFVCYLAGFGTGRSVKTKFRVGNGKNFEFLTENQSYQKNY